MKIKKYYQFINEQISPNINKNTWTLSKDDIEEYLIDFIHNRYIINIDFGFADRFLKEDKTIKSVFNQDLKKYGSEETQAYFITIFPDMNPTNPTLDEDLTDSLHFACDNFRDLVAHDNLFGADVEIYDEGGKLDINNIVVKKESFIKTDDGSPEIEGYLGILIIENKKVKITPKKFCDYYGWKYDELKGDMVYAHIDVEDMSNALLSSNSSFKKELINGIDDSEYLSSDYQPDTSSLIQYILNKDNSILLIKKVIEEIGGIKKVINKIKDECYNSVYEKVKEMSEDQLIEFLLKEKSESTLKTLCKKSEIVKEIKQTCGYWEMDACIEQNQKELWDEFIDIVDKEIKNYKIIEKEVTKYYTTSSGEKKEYKEVEKFFSLPLNNDWMEEMDYDYKIQLGSVADVFYEWQSNMCFNYELEPNFSSSGYVDLVGLNKEIKTILENYLKN
jgi:hypothetical protein